MEVPVRWKCNTTTCKYFEPETLEDLPYTVVIAVISIPDGDRFTWKRLLSPSSYDVNTEQLIYAVHVPEDDVSKFMYYRKWGDVDTANEKKSGSMYNSKIDNTLIQDFKSMEEKSDSIKFSMDRLTKILSRYNKRQSVGTGRRLRM